MTAHRPNIVTSLLTGLLCGMLVMVYELDISSPPVVIGIILGIGVFIWSKWRVGIWVAVLTLGIVVGVFRGSVAMQEQSVLLSSSDITTRVESVEQREKNLRIQAVDKSTGNRILVYVDPFSEIQPGDTINVAGEIQRPEEFEGFNWPMYLAAKDIYLVSYYPDINVSHSENSSSILERVNIFRSNLTNKIQQILPRNIGGIVQAMVVGLRGDIPEDVEEDFRRSGLSHMLAVSGLHMGLVGGMVFLLLIKFIPIHRIASGLIAASIMAGYVVLSGVSPSALRSAIMAGVILIAIMISEKTNYSRLLLLVATTLALIQPLQLRWDASFMLSFSAVVGILATKSFFDFALSKIPNKLKMRDVLSLSLAVQVTTWPIVLGMFGMVSIVSPIINVIVALFVAPFLGISIILALSLILIPFISTPISLIVWGLGAIITSIAHVGSMLPFAVLSNIQISPEFMSVYYALVVIGVITWKQYWRNNLTPAAKSRKEGL